MEALHLALVIFAGVWSVRAWRLDRADKLKETEPHEENEQ